MEDYIFRELVSVKADEPVQTEVHWIKVDLLKLLMDCWKHVFYQDFENLGIGLHPNHVVVVVDGKH